MERLWQVIGTGKSGKPTSIKVRARNYQEAREEAIKRRVIIESVRLIDENSPRFPTHMVNNGERKWQPTESKQQ